MLTAMVSSFMSEVNTSGDCWLWTGTLNGSGYGQFQDGSAHGVGAHRFSHEVFLGDIKGGHVRHTCRNRHCVKPTHLTSGTSQDNMRDKFFDGTQNTQKLTPEDVREIRRRFVRYSKYRSNRNELAAEFGISPKHLQRVAEGRKLEYVK